MTFSKRRLILVTRNPSASDSVSVCSPLHQTNLSIPRSLTRPNKPQQTDKMDPKVKNMLKYMAKNLALPLIAIVGAIKVFGITDYIRLLGQVALVIIVWRGGLSIYRRRIQPAKKPLEFGKWAIITGNANLTILTSPSIDDRVNLRNRKGIHRLPS